MSELKKEYEERNDVRRSEIHKARSEAILQRQGRTGYNIVTGIVHTLLFTTLFLCDICMR